MSDYNQITLLGNAGQNPEGRSTADGTRVVSCSLATSEKWTDAKGQQREKTEWHRLTFWNTGRRALADLAERAIKQGDRLFIVGKLRYRSWDADGETKYSTEIEVSEIRFLTPKPSVDKRALEGSSPNEPGAMDDRRQWRD